MGNGIFLLFFPWNVWPAVNPIQCIFFSYVFIFRNLIWISLYLPCFYLTFWPRRVQLYLLFQCPCLLILTCAFSGLVSIDFSLSVYVFLCIPGNFRLGGKPCEFYLAECWVFLYFNKYYWVFFWDAVKSLGNSLVLSGLAFKTSWIG